MTLMVPYNSQNIVEAQPSVNREFSEEMRYIDWSYSEDVVDYISFLLMDVFVVRIAPVRQITAGVIYYQNFADCDISIIKKADMIYIIQE